MLQELHANLVWKQLPAVAGKDVDKSVYTKPKKIRLCTVKQKEWAEDTKMLCREERNCTTIAYSL